MTCYKVNWENHYYRLFTDEHKAKMFKLRLIQSGIKYVSMERVKL